MAPSRVVASSIARRRHRSARDPKDIGGRDTAAVGEQEVRVVEELQAALPRDDIVAGLVDPASQLQVADALSRLATPNFEVRMVGPEYLVRTTSKAAG